MDWCRLLNPNRRRQTTIPNDHRGQFERDFDRAIFSTPVKRLQDKAQVFPLEPHDAVRTRLTHSLEVSSVARGLAARSAKWLREEGEISGDMDRSIEAIAATCGLIHDLGNPPFGHAGEDAIRAWFKKPPQAGVLNNLQTDQHVHDFLRFEGNAQSLRLVAKLQILVDHTGLNLTFGTLSALRKYLSSSDPAEKTSDNPAFQKPGYFASENDIIPQIQHETGTEGARHPICLLVEAADDIAYLPADVEDAVKKGVVSWKTIESQLTAIEAESVTKALNGQKAILTAGSASLPNDLDDDISASAFRTAAIRVMVDAVFCVFRNQYEDILRGKYPRSLLDDSNAKDLAHCLRTIAKKDVYSTRSTLLLELMGRHVIGDLMDVFWEGAQAMPAEGTPKASKFAGKAAALVSPNYRKIFQATLAEGRLPEDYCRLQLVTDYICGMTDSFATNLHSDLFNGR